MVEEATAHARRISPARVGHKSHTDSSSRCGCASVAGVGGRCRCAKPLLLAAQSGDCKITHEISVRCVPAHYVDGMISLIWGIGGYPTATGA
jgi:hypothetical protein